MMDTQTVTAICSLFTAITAIIALPVTIIISMSKKD